MIGLDVARAAEAAPELVILAGVGVATLLVLAMCVVVRVGTWLGRSDGDR